MKTLLTLVLFALSGFNFGHVEAPDGTEWQNEQTLSLNKQLPHAWFFSFSSLDEARKVLPYESEMWMSLDGDWKFHWAGNPEERPQDFFKPGYDDSQWDMIPVPSNWNIVGLEHDGSQKYGTPIYVNVGVPWFFEKKTGDWKLGVMRTPPEDYTVYKNRNEVGSYRRTFEVPDAWDGKQVFINFDGVDSFFYLWINGQYVGFSKNSRNVAQFDITEYLQKGENTLAVEVYRFCDGSNFEAQDMFRLPGIFRTVALEAKPKMHVRDIKVDSPCGELVVKADIVGAKDGKIDWHLYEVKLYGDATTEVKCYENCPAGITLQYPDCKPWSAERPQRYVLAGELKDANGKVQDIFSTYVGFRSVEIRDTEAKDDEFGIAGRYFYINGKAVKLRGVNRHETDPARGHAVTKESMEWDVLEMKRNNINHVRDSHYPDAPYWYYLCDKYGIYLMDEGNIESHHYGYEEESLSHVKEFLPTHLGRMCEMMTQNYNHPSIVIWSMGNEAGPGDNFKETYHQAKAFDPMRPVQYERNNDISDIGCRQYPRIWWMEEVASGNADVKYPYHVNEFAHSMGNALGNFADYWYWMDSNNHFMGGAIWDWVDQSLWNWTADGTQYLASGGDFGDIPNSGQFVMNGVLFGDRTPKPQLAEVKKVYQNIYTTLIGDKRIEVFNRNYFEPVSCNAKWEILCEGKVFSRGSFDTGVLEPRSHNAATFDWGTLPEGRECYLNISFRTKEDLPWAEAGYEIAREQLMIQQGGKVLPQTRKCGRALKSNSADGRHTIRGRGFKVVFDDAEGTICSLKYRGKEVFVCGGGPRLHPYRAFTNNDRHCYIDWLDNGLDSLIHTATPVSVAENEDGCIALTYDIVSQAPRRTAFEGTCFTNKFSLSRGEECDTLTKFTSRVVWTVRKNGQVECSAEISHNFKGLSLARLGYEMVLPERMSQLTYYGRGPQENYSDRFTSAFVGVYGSTVAEQFTPYTCPQETGNHEQVRFLTLGRGRRGVAFFPLENDLCCDDSYNATMSFSALPYADDEIAAATHVHELPAMGDTHLVLSAAVLGLGGASCGPDALEQDRVTTGAKFAFAIAPLK